MSDQLCTHCENLPVTNKRRGAIQRCPLCKTNLLITNQGRLRLNHGALPEAPPHRTWQIALMVGCAMIFIAAFTALQFTHLDQPKQPSMQVADLEAVVDGPPTAEPAPLPAIVPKVSIGTNPKPPMPPANQVKPERITMPREWVQSEPEPKKNYQPKYSDAELAKQLLGVPEVELMKASTKPITKTNAKKIGKAYVTEMKDVLKIQMRKVLAFQIPENRPDLIGLPFRKGKDCQLSEAAAQGLADSSSFIRPVVDELKNGKPKNSISHEFMYSMRRDLRTFYQVLSGEGDELRQFMVAYLEGCHSQDATVGLSKSAIFENKAEIRSWCRGTLASRSKKDYIDLVRKTLRYPWQPAVQHAAETIVEVNLLELVPELLICLDLPEPTRPFSQERSGKKVLMKRELVRINHLRNCILCHAQATGRIGTAVGAVPTYGSALPRLSRAYYKGMRRDGIFVRAEVTYLRQDFSVLQPVQNAKPWPKMQRFDFLVRTRRLKDKEVVDFKQRETLPGPLPISSYHQSILYALRELTGQDFGMNTVAWRAYFTATKLRR